MADKKKPVTHTKMSPEERTAWLQFLRRGSKVQAKKGKGSFKRHGKYKNKFE